ncbi:hypothetical protein F5Y08DRAFT_208260 [Xylaria arbuscula]|nr:hypothetical protein F5Y08DRAFT_208260 [Xylaria arbuscula]
MPPRPNTGREALPRSFKCRKCSKNKPPAEFSQSQIQKWRTKKRNDRYNTITPETAELICKDHSSDQRQIRCHGPCDLVKIVDHFSKAQRNNNEPWCIDCTEWKEEFDGDEVPTAVPNAPLTADEYDGFGGGDDDVGHRKLGQMSLNDDKDDDKSSSDDDSDGNPYGDPTVITKAIDRLQGYGANDDTKTAAASSTKSVTVSGWGGTATNTGRSESGHGRGTATSNPMVHGSTRTDARSQGYSPFNPTGVPPHLRNWASPPSMNQGPQPTSQYHPIQAGPSTGWGARTTVPSSQVLSSSSNPKQTSDAGLKERAHALANDAAGAWKTTGRKQDARKENTSKWYKGDNRKVFPAQKQTFGERVQDGTEAAHDSDSPDEM